MMQGGVCSKFTYYQAGKLLQRHTVIGETNIVQWYDVFECGSSNHYNSVLRTNPKCYSTTKKSFRSSTGSSPGLLQVPSLTLLPLEKPQKLQVVPTLPYLGSQISFISGMPKRRFEKEYEWQLQMRAKYGDFYSYGVPGLGSGTHGIVYTVSDPREYMKVVRQEGRYPFGMTSFLWPLTRYCTEKNIAAARGPNRGFFGRSDDWKIIRNFLQTDLLSPQAASGYIPGIIAAAEYASKGAPSNADQLDQYLNCCTFDMFCTIMFGELVQVVDPTTSTDPVNLEFIQNVVKFFNVSTKMRTDIKEIFSYRALNIKTEKYKEFEAAADNVFRISGEKVRQFQRKYDQGTLDEYQRHSYLANAIKRQREQTENPVTGDNSSITEEMMIDICVLLLIASIDTTSCFMSFALMHMALNPEAQEKVYQEIKNNMVSKETGRLTTDVISKRSVAPYLHAVLRESHRLTPTGSTSIIKQVSAETEIHGITIPTNSMVAFNNYAILMDPLYVEDPEAFRPERWLPDAIEARKGTPYEVIDHPFFKDPFSQGARKCPGSRVAVNELLCFLAQLILDYKIRAPPHIQSYKEIPTTLRGVFSPILPKLEFIPRQR